MGAIEWIYARSRRSSAIRGVIACGLGLVMMRWPGQISKFIVGLLGLVVLAIGIFGTLATIMSRSRSRTANAMLIAFIFCIALGSASIAKPGLMAAILIGFLGVVALAYGIAGLYVVVRSAARSRLSLIEGLLCIVAIILGIVLFLRPLHAASAAVGLAGLLLFVLGIFWLIMALTRSKQVS